MRKVLRLWIRFAASVSDQVYDALLNIMVFRILRQAQDFTRPDETPDGFRQHIGRLQPADPCPPSRMAFPKSVSFWSPLANPAAHLPQHTDTALNKLLFRITRRSLVL